MTSASLLGVWTNSNPAFVGENLVYYVLTDASGSGEFTIREAGRFIMRVQVDVIDATGTASYISEQEIVFQSADGTTVDPQLATVKIVSALVNSEGHDAGSERVTLLNNSDKMVSLHNWSLADNAKQFTLADHQLAPGQAITLVLPQYSIQLSNIGVSIHLKNKEGQTVHSVTYQESQVKEQGKVLTF